MFFKYAYELMTGPICRCRMAIPSIIMCPVCPVGFSHSTIRCCVQLPKTGHIEQESLANAKVNARQHWHVR